FSKPLFIFTSKRQNTNDHSSANPLLKSQLNRLSEIKNNKNLGARILHRLSYLLRPEQCHQN
ncbi:MAG: hypothetical protein E6588_19070, partial [Acinetobacter sp.]|nr:hypothetical protein [Acinetobacter sp.]